MMGCWFVHWSRLPLLVQGRVPVSAQPAAAVINVYSLLGLFADNLREALTFALPVHDMISYYYRAIDTVRCNHFPT